MIDASVEIGPLRSGPVLVTGAGGFIGRNLVETLAKEGVLVVGMIRHYAPRLDDLAPKIQIIKCDLLEKNEVHAAVRAIRPRFIFHLAGMVVNSEDANEVIAANVTATANLLRVINDDAFEQFVYVGSASEYGAGERLSERSPIRPTSLYGATKAAGHILAHCFRRMGIPVISVRPFTTYGPWESPRRLISSVCRSALDDRDMLLTDGYQTRDFVYVEDVVKGLIAAASLVGSDALDAVNLCSGVPVSVREVVLAIVKLSGTRAMPKFGAIPARAGDPLAECGDPAVARTVLHWASYTPLAAGLQRTLEWITSNREIQDKL